MLSTMLSWKQVNPPYKFKWTEKTVPVAEGSSETTTEGLKQGESINVQDLERNLYWEFGKFTSQDGESLESYYSRSYKKIYKPTNNNLRTSSNTSRANQDNSLRINRGTGYENQRVVNVAGAKENVGTQVVQKSRIQCYNCKEYRHASREFTPDAADNSGPIFDVEPLQKVQNDDDNYNVFDNDQKHPEQPESVNEPYSVEQDEHNIIIDSLDMCYDREQDDQDDTDDLAKEHDLLASLIEKLKCEIDDKKNRNKFLESSNKALVDKLKDLKKFQVEIDRYHDVNYALKVEIDCAKAKGDLMEYYYADHMNAILGVYTTLDEFTDLQCDYVDQVVKCERLEKELSKKREQYFEIQDLKAQLQDKGIAISELKKLIENMKGKSVETKLEKSSVIRQPNAFKSQRQTILGKPAIFSDSLAKTDFSKSKSVTKNNVSNDFSKPVTAHILPQSMKSILKNTNVIAPGMYKEHTKPNQTRTPQLPLNIQKTNKRMSFSTGVIPTTSVSRPQLKSNQLEDRVMPNNSQGKKQEVEDHRRNFKFSNNKMFVTVCNDSLNTKTLDVNFVCVTCGKYMLNDNHDMCVLHYINGLNSITKMPMAMPISTREPKRTVNQSAATAPYRESFHQKLQPKT
ncbi:hypothetical protein Tco_0566144 [Tanacetum coccineum]